jgi:hypothetical protein
MKLITLLLSAAFANAATYTETVDLQNAGQYAVLAMSGISTIDARIEGDIGVSPIAATAMTGFGLEMDENGQHSKSSLVGGRCYGADHAVPSPAVLTQAVIQMQEAYTKASLRTTSDSSRINLLNGDIGGQTLTPGVYSFTTAINIYSTLYLDGDEDDVFIIQTTGVLTIAADTYVKLAGNVQAKNIFWVVAGNAALGARSIFKGVLLVKTDVAMLAGSTLEGRVLSQTAVNLMEGAKVTEARVDVTVGPRQEWINLEEACAFAVISEKGTTNMGGGSMIIGDMGLSPAAASYNTGFGESLPAGSPYATSAQVSGKMYAADYAVPTPAMLTKAVIAWQAAYTNAAGRVNLDQSRINIGGGDIGGLVLTPGVYTFDRGVQIQLDVTFDGGPDDVFIIQTTGVLSTPTAGKKVILTGGAQAKNVIWQVAGNVALKADTQFQGIIMTWSYAALEARATVNGAVFAKTQVTLIQNTITGAAGNCAAPTEYVDPPAPTPAPVAQQKAVELGTSKDYAITAVGEVKTTPSSTVTGNIAVSGSQDTIVGFGLTLDVDGKFAVSSQLSGKVFASDMLFPVPNELTAAVKAMIEAFVDAMGRPNFDDARINLGGGDIGGKVLTPGVYTFTVSLDIPEDITLDGGPNDVFIIQVDGPLTLADDTEVLLSGGVDPNNVFWVVTGPVSVGSDSSMQGVIMGADDILMKPGSNLDGRIQGQKNVVLQVAVIGTEAAFCT